MNGAQLRSGDMVVSIERATCPIEMFCKWPILKGTTLAAWVTPENQFPKFSAFSKWPVHSSGSKTQAGWVLRMAYWISGQGLKCRAVKTRSVGRGQKR